MSDIFEMGKFYQHVGSERIHIIAEARDSEMWMIDPGKSMFIAEERGGSLYAWGQADIDPTLDQNASLNLRDKLPNGPMEIQGLRPVSSHRQDMNGWFEITRELFKLEQSPESMDIKHSIYRQSKGVGREHVGFKYKLTLISYNLKPQRVYYLLDHVKYNACMIKPLITKSISEIIESLISLGVEKKKIYEIEQKMFKQLI